jgi:hypothetical protein
MDNRSAGERARGLLLQLMMIVIALLMGIMVFDILSGSVEPVAGTTPPADG